MKTLADVFFFSLLSFFTKLSEDSGEFYEAIVVP